MTLDTGLEKILREAHGKHFNLCSVCIDFGKPEKWMDEKTGCAACVKNNYSNWQLNQAQFEGKAKK